MEGTRGAVQLFIQKDEIELADYIECAKVGDLMEALGRMQRRPGLATVGCAGCGLCCRDRVPVLGSDLKLLEEGLGISRTQLIRDHLDLPVQPDPEERSVQISDLARQISASITEATLLYEWNTGEPLVPKQAANGFCHWLHDRRCSIYLSRPLICSFYLCNFGNRLSGLFDSIVRQGIWYSYVVLGWIDRQVVAHNPFVAFDDPTNAPLAAFDIDVGPLLKRIAEV